LGENFCGVCLHYVGKISLLLLLEVHL